MPAFLASIQSVSCILDTNVNGSPSRLVNYQLVNFMAKTKILVTVWVHGYCSFSKIQSEVLWQENPREKSDQKQLKVSSKTLGEKHYG